MLAKDIANIRKHRLWDDYVKARGSVCWASRGAGRKSTQRDLTGASPEVRYFRTLQQESKVSRDSIARRIADDLGISERVTVEDVALCPDAVEVVSQEGETGWMVRTFEIFVDGKNEADTELVMDTIVVQDLDLEPHTNGNPYARGVYLTEWGHAWADIFPRIRFWHEVTL